MEKIEERIREILSKTDSKGFLKKREGNDVEYKESFINKSLAKYIKTAAAFANKNGGVLIFGVKDSPHKKIGLNNETFEKYDNAEFSKSINDILEPEILFEKGIIEIDNLKFGYYYFKESNNKPIITKKNFGNNQEIKEGEIYFRYSARNEKIRYSELKNILNENKKKFEKDWINIIKNISDIGINNINLINLKNGDTFDKNGKYVIFDSEILKEMNYIKEGEFIEKEGAPTLTLKGELEVINKNQIFNVDKKSLFNKTSDELHKNLQNKLELYKKVTKSQYYLVNGLLKKLCIVDNYKYHLKDRSGKRTTNLYSEEALKICYDFLFNKEKELNTKNLSENEKILEFKNFLRSIVAEFKKKQI